jgi:hypothetical protein
MLEDQKTQAIRVAGPPEQVARLSERRRGEPLIEARVRRQRRRPAVCHLLGGVAGVCTAARTGPHGHQAVEASAVRRGHVQSNLAGARDIGFQICARCFQICVTPF